MLGPPLLVGTHLVGDIADEGLDIQVGGTALLAGGIGTFETSV